MPPTTRRTLSRSRKLRRVTVSRDIELMSMHPLDVRDYLNGLFRLPKGSDEIAFPAVLIYLWQDDPITLGGCGKILQLLAKVPRKLGFLSATLPKENSFQHQVGNRDFLWGFCHEDLMISTQAQNTTKQLEGILELLISVLQKGGGACAGIGPNPYAAYGQTALVDNGQVALANDDQVVEADPIGLAVAISNPNDCGYA